MSMSLGNEILRRLVNDMTVHHLEEMEDVDLQRLTDQLWRWHDKALSELLKRGHVVPQRNPILRAEAQVFLVVNDPNTGDFNMFDYKGSASADGRHNRVKL